MYFFENLNQNKVDEILNTLNGMTQPTKDDIKAIMSEIEDIFKTTVTTHSLSRKTSTLTTKQAQTVNPGSTITVDKHGRNIT